MWTLWISTHSSENLSKMSVFQVIRLWIYQYQLLRGRVHDLRPERRRDLHRNHSAGRKVYSLERLLQLRQDWPCWGWRVYLAGKGRNHGDQRSSGNSEIVFVTYRSEKPRCHLLKSCTSNKYYRSIIPKIKHYLKRKGDKLLFKII